MSVTAPFCGMGDILRQDLHDAVAALPVSRRSRSSWCSIPPWDASRLSDVARLELGMMSVEQRIDLADDHLALTLTVTAADRAMPAMVGWHPWFRRRLLQDRSVELVLRFDAGKMYERDQSMVPSGRLVDPTPGPWDDCFTEVDQPLTLEWPGAVELSLTSSCDHWVVYNRRPDGVCVEPQSDGPDAFNRVPRVLRPGETLSATYTIAWRLSGDVS
jgi:aldose 1-epimerase